MKINPCFLTNSFSTKQINQINQIKQIKQVNQFKSVKAAKAVKQKAQPKMKLKSLDCKMRTFC